MNRIMTFALVTFLFPFGAVMAQSFTDMGDRLLDGLPKGKKSRIAILDFETRSNDLEQVSEIVRERLTTYIVQTNRAEVIERRLLKKLLEEHQLEVSGIIDDETGNKIGKLLGVSAVITGTVSSLSGKEAEVNARLVRVDTAKILSAANLIVTTDRAKSQIVNVAFKSQSYKDDPAVQIALLLDTSNSMDGLIQQAKTQLWKIVNKLADAERAGKNPKIAIALYEYGNSGLEEQGNYLRQVLPLTENLDLVSEKLFSLKTNGGDEYAGAVIRHAVRNLTWNTHAGIYRAIFIAGNEPFTQGPIPFQDAISDAERKNIFVNTIYCGPEQEGIATGWKEGAVAGRGMFLNIDQEQRIVAIQAPQDKKIQELGNNINTTFIPYGESGKKAAERQSEADEMAVAEAPSGAAVQRSLFKSKAQYQSSMTWDLVTLAEQGKFDVKKIDKKNLPKNLQKMSDREIEKYIASKVTERKKIRERIAALEKEREKYVAEEEKKRIDKSSARSLDKAMEQAVEFQASDLDYEFK